MTNLRLYAIQDSKTGVCSMFATSASDEFAVNFYFNTFNQMFKGLKGKKKEKERIEFMNHLHSSKLVRLADIDISQPSVTQNLAFVADFKDLIIKDKEKDENGV